MVPSVVLEGVLLPALLGNPFDFASQCLRYELCGISWSGGRRRRKREDWISSGPLTEPAGRGRCCRCLSPSAHSHNLYRNFRSDSKPFSSDLEHPSARLVSRHASYPWGNACSIATRSCSALTPSCRCCDYSVQLRYQRLVRRPTAFSALLKQFSLSSSPSSVSSSISPSLALYHGDNDLSIPSTIFGLLTRERARANRQRIASSSTLVSLSLLQPHNRGMVRLSQSWDLQQYECIGGRR